MTVTIYTLNNWLLYFIYLRKGFMSVITIIGVQLDNARSTARAVSISINRIPRWGYSSNSSSSIEVGVNVASLTTLSRSRSVTPGSYCRPNKAALSVSLATINGKLFTTSRSSYFTVTIILPARSPVLFSYVLSYNTFDMQVFTCILNWMNEWKCI